MNERNIELCAQAGIAIWGDAVYMYDPKDTLDSAMLEKLINKIRADEREAIAQMFEGSPALIPFAQNERGGCMICGFTPKLALETIRARGTYERTIQRKQGGTNALL